MGIDPRVIVYLLASPFGQLQFQQAESGASGQTAVTEDDVRRFRFPKIQVSELLNLVNELDKSRNEIAEAKRKLDEKEKGAWERFNISMFQSATKR